MRHDALPYEDIVESTLRPEKTAFLRLTGRRTPPEIMGVNNLAIPDIAGLARRNFVADVFVQTRDANASTARVVVHVVRAYVEEEVAIIKTPILVSLF